MPNQMEKADYFRKLHIAGQPLVLFNIWDPGSAKAVEAAGADAIATGSWSVSRANGYADGEHMPLDCVIANLARIVKSTDCPTTIDLESGYAKTPDMVAISISRTIEAGAVGCNLEDSFPESGKLRSIAEQIERIGFARQAADKSGIAYFINARTDVFLQPSEPHDDALCGMALDRARAYADAGADGIFVPGLVGEALIARLAAVSPLPLNIMVDENSPPLSRLAKAGVARVSHGPGPYILMMKALEKAAREAMGQHEA